MKKSRLSIPELDELLQRIGGCDALDPSPDLASRTLARIAPLLGAMRARRRALAARVALAGILSFPVIVGLNAAAAWVLYLALDRMLPGALAAGLTATVGVLMLLALSLSYGSLPLLLSIGLRRFEAAP
jgi:hypothetical protein